VWIFIGISVLSWGPLRWERRGGRCGSGVGREVYREEFLNIGLVGENVRFCERGDGKSHDTRDSAAKLEDCGGGCEEAMFG